MRTENAASIRVTTTRNDVLTEANEIIGGERAQTYGDATESFGKVGDLWSVILGRPGITAEEVALCMTALKMARLINSPGHRDSWVDAAGYIALGAEAAL